MTEPVTFTPPEPNAALVVGPDDTLVISLPIGTVYEQLRRFADELRALYPALDGRLLVMTGAEGLAVIRSSAPASPRG